MKNKHCLSAVLDVKAFTLIELLVVVLIIGILAAVALPQYEKAVTKARVAAALPLLRTLANAQETHYMATGSYASFDELDVEFPAGTTEKTDYWKLPDNQRFWKDAWKGGYQAVSVNFGAARGAIQLNYIFEHATVAEQYTRQAFYCSAANNDSVGLAVCKSLSESNRVSGVCALLQETPTHCIGYRMK